MGPWTKERWTSTEAASELLAVLPLLARIVATEVRREAGEDTTMPQYRVLAHLAERSLTLSDLARRRHVTLQSMGELVQSLVERGWITRSPAPNDRRQHILTLTEQGRQHYEQAQAQLLARLVPILDQLNPEEMTAVQICLPALRRVLNG